MGGGQSHYIIQFTEFSTGRDFGLHTKKSGTSGTNKSCTNRVTEDIYTLRAQKSAWSRSKGEFTEAKFMLLPFLQLFFFEL